MRRVFTDTSFYIALLNPRDEGHDRAEDFARQFRGQQVTTDFVLIEVGNWLSRSGDRALFVSLLEQLQADPNAFILAASRELFRAGCELYRRRGDKDWSMTDSISFTVMEAEGLTEALTADHHFEQAGFKVLLK